MTTTTLARTPTTIDVRTVAPRIRHALILSTFRDLADGQSMQIVNDHDPKPLYHLFQAEVPGRFEWHYLEAGPELWRVSLMKTEVGSCCGGGCGGRG
jgi:uncharacterized protein (DUF2249 family)